MRADERNEGDYRILARALPAPSSGGYVAAVTVQRVRGIANAPREAYHDECLAGGYAWPSVEAARLYALAKAQEVIREEPFRLAC